ncbi:MAG: hypothetical protein AUK44_02335 [Porphyromonadaceae bacterium CG2_30_38_12]|nr:MAG: hypothetical protein AUK44_02335 [Porphyromonadaceae bacterium CG2_30_38_12]
MIDKTKQFEKLMMNHLSENISDNDEGVLLDILNSDPKFKVQYNEMVKTRAISLIPIIESEKNSNYKNLLQLLNYGLSLNRQPVFLQYFFKVAAIIIFVLSTSISTYYIYNGYNNSSKNLMSYETVVPLGSQTKIVLPDGTVAWLNSGSTLKYNNSYGDETRTVNLTGEGYFEVQKNPKKPFLVYANDIKVKVLGTVFNVRSYADENAIEVDLLEGKVDVSFESGNDTKILSLLPNEKMVFNKANKTITSHKVDASRSSTWTTGKLCFVDATLEDIAKNLERKYDIQIEIKSQRIKEELFSGSLDLNQPIEKILEYIDVDKKYTRVFNGKNVSLINQK